MKIIKNKDNEYIDFEDLENGAVFTVDDETYFLKIEAIKTIDNCFINAVALDDGESAFFYHNDNVIPVNAALVIGED